MDTKSHSPGARIDSLTVTALLLAATRGANEDAGARLPVGPHVQKPLRVGTLTCQIERGSRTLLACVCRSVSEKRSALRKARHNVRDPRQGVWAGDPAAGECLSFVSVSSSPYHPKNSPAIKPFHHFRGTKSPHFSSRLGCGCQAATTRGLTVAYAHS